MLAHLSNSYGQPWSDETNGNEVWAIVRNLNVTTIVFRRSTQPMTPAAFSSTR